MTHDKTGIAAQSAVTDRSAFAWEILRRNPAYRTEVKIQMADTAIETIGNVTVIRTEQSAAPWGLQFR